MSAGLKWGCLGYMKHRVRFRKPGWLLKKFIPFVRMAFGIRHGLSARKLLKKLRSMLITHDKSAARFYPHPIGRSYPTLL